MDNESKKRKNVGIGQIKDNIQLGLFALPTIILLGVFAYWPMFGIVLAFKNFKVTKGIYGSDWNGFKNFEFFFKSQDAWRVTRNTIGLNLLFIGVGLACAIAVALLMFEVVKAMHVKIYQTVSIIPSFLSWPVVGIIVYTLLDPTKGIVNQLITTLGGTSIDWYSKPEYWPLILLITRIWHGVGLGSIIYYAALMGIDSEMFEAAEIDGASKLQRTRYISIPQIVPIITIMTIMDIGRIFRADFGLFYNVTRDVGKLYPTTDVIDTYVFRALMSNGNIGMSSAVGLFQSVVCLIMILLTNWIVRKIEPDNSLF